MWLGEETKAISKLCFYFEGVALVFSRKRLLNNIHIEKVRISSFCIVAVVPHQYYDLVAKLIVTCLARA
ncbi:hypothetical protein Ahy_B06g086091 isoform C [Arachis hypogaea]|uniref:Uncharacterized protein n=1 Tax=Arachis hypogaea TaxID=3818 RepID=A0A444YWS6_ARAHY|nr:hypothetical protein Ahy_B06g086091 isoform C [Arachis hypogaea]